MFKSLLIRVLTAIFKLEVIRRDGSDYLWRWHVAGNRSGRGIYLHHFIKGDNDPDPHSHPWGFTTLVLAGGYVDECWKKDADGRVVHDRYQTCKPGRLYCRRASHIHRVLLPEGKTGWTLVFRGKRFCDWGFYVGDRFVHWKEYLKVTQQVVNDGS